MDCAIAPNFPIESVGQRIYTQIYPPPSNYISKPIHNIPDDMRDIPANSGGDVGNGAKPAALWPAEVIGGRICSVHDNIN